MHGEFSLTRGTAALSAARDEWDALGVETASPFLTHSWLNAWATANDSQRLLTATVQSRGRLLAGALFREVPGGLASAADVYSGDWDVVAADDDARRRLWDGIAGEAPRRLLLAGMRTGSRSTLTACHALQGAGYGVLPSVGEEASPYIRLPSSFADLLASLSHNSRKQVRKRRRQLEAAGQVTIRTVTSGEGLEQAFDAFLDVEGSGWKGRAGTAIASNARTESLFRTFSREAAERGWLRLLLLELDGRVLAGGLGASIGGEWHLLKIGYDESYGHLSPGSVLVAETLRAAIEEGHRGLDLLGQSYQFKARWTEETRPRQRLRAFRGSAGRVAERQWNGHLHPALVRLRDRAREDPALRRRLDLVRPIVDRVTGN